MPEAIVLNELKPLLYKEGCPIVIDTGLLLLDQESGGVSAVMTFRNISPRTITSVLVDIHLFDRANTEIEVVRDYLYLVPGAQRNQLFGKENHIAIGSDAAKSFSVAIRRVAFDDDTLWDGSASLLFEGIPGRRSIADELEDDETIQQFVRDFASNIATDPKVTAKYVPVEYKDLWLCACTGINRKDEERCFLCGAAYMPQRIHIDNRVEIAANLAAHKRALAEQAERDRLEAERKAAEAAAAKAEAERKAAEEKARQEERARRKKRAIKVFLSVSIPLLIAALIYLIIHFTYLLPQGRYNQARALMSGGRYDEAITAFSAMGGYSDSPDQVVEAKYQKAEALLNSGDYDAAIDQYTAISKSRDVADRIAEAKYRRADEHFAAKSYTEALAIFTEINDYRDSSDKIQAGSFQLAKAELKEAETPTPKLKELFAAVSAKDSLTLQQLFCDTGSALYTGGKTAEAELWFALIADKALLQTVDQVHYDGAMALIKSKKYDEATALLKALADYKDSPTQLLRISYLKAEAQLKAKKYTEAIALYKEAGSYEDAKSKISECNYRIAAATLGKGEYEKAEKQFKELGKYKDSATQALEARYRLGARQLESGQAVASYNTLYPIRSYDKAYALLVSNSQYYIHVYDVGVGPNPLDNR